MDAKYRRSIHTKKVVWKNDTAVAVADSLNLAGLVSCVANLMALVVTILSDQSGSFSTSRNRVLVQS